MFSLNTSQLRSNPVTQRASGFTLIEMLVATALVVLMMTIFAEVFQMASGSMVLQRTIAENDQQVRTFVTVMRADLQKRTFRKVIPYYPREDFNDQGESFSGRKGYFYVSLNDPNNASDTVLQLTVDASIKDESADETPYYGKATRIPPPTGATQAQQDRYFRINPNQPEHDDGQVSPNGAASSSAAQVAYFVRNGTLYRRVVLLREPLSVSGADDPQPKRSDGADPFDPLDAVIGVSSEHYAGEFWNDFDFSGLALLGAHYSLSGNHGTRFLGLRDLDNQHRGIPVSSPEFPLGRSRYRFGFDQITGQSREFFGATNQLFLGRFTQQETSDPDFDFPQPIAASGNYGLGGNPFSPSLTLDDAIPAPDGVVDSLEGGSRVGEDILLTHVHSFEVELFDERLQSFAPIGHSLTNPKTGLAGDFHVGRLLNTGYFAPGMGQAAGRVFDTWHPLYDQDGSPPVDQLPLDNLAPMTQDNPPYRPMEWDPVGLSAPMPSNQGGVSQWTPGVDYKPWQDTNGNGTYDVGVDTPADVVFPPTEDTNYNGILDMGEDGQFGFASDSKIDQPVVSVRMPVKPYGRSYYYVCRRARSTNPSGVSTPLPMNYTTDQPAWSVPGRVFGHDNHVSVSVDPDEKLYMHLWEAIPNLKPVRAVRITVRFLHRGSNKLRQFTLVHSLRD